MRLRKQNHVTAKLTISFVVVTILLSGCGKDSAANPNGTSSKTTKTPVKNVINKQAKEFNIVYSRDLEQAPRSSVRGNDPAWPPIEFEPANMNFGIVPPHTIGKGSARIWNVGNRPLRIKETLPPGPRTHPLRSPGPSRKRL